MATMFDIFTSVGVIVVYFVAILIVGNYAWKVFKPDTFEKYVLAGRGLSWVIVLVSAMATQFSALTFLGFIGYVYRFGAACEAGIAASYYFVSMLWWLFFAGRLWLLGKRYGHATPADATSQFYESKAVGYVHSVALMVALIPYMMVQILGVGYVMNVASYGTIPVVGGQILVFIIMLCYEFVGGHKAQAWVNTLQGFIMLGAILGGAIAFASLTLGGVEGIFKGVAESQPALLTMPGVVPVFGSLYLATWSITLGLGWPSHTHMYQKLLAAKRVTIPRAYALFGATFGSLCIYVPNLIVGLNGRVLWPTAMPPGTNPDWVFVLLAQRFLPPILMGAFAAAGIAAMQSSIDSQSLAVASMFVNDFARKVKRDISEKTLVWATRGLITVFTFIALVLSLGVPALILTLGGFAAAFGAVTLTALTCALAGQRWVTKYGVIASVIIGEAVTFVIAGIVPGVPTWLINYAGIYSGMWGVITSIIVLVIVSLATPSAKPSEEAVKMYKEVGW